MNTRDKAAKAIFDFLESDERCLLLTGTHMLEKHNLVLSILASEENKRILLRVNALKNLDDVLNIGNNIKTGTLYQLGHNDLYFDSFDAKSWRKSPNDLYYAVIYPVDSMISQKGINKNPIIDIIHRGCKKIFLIGWSEMYDFSLFNEFVDQKVVFDAEEEYLEYHKRVSDGLRK